MNLVNVQHADFVTNGVFEERIELCYLKLASLKNVKADVKGLVDYVADHEHSYFNQIIIEHKKIHALRLF